MLSAPWHTTSTSHTHQCNSIHNGRPNRVWAAISQVQHFQKSQVWTHNYSYIHWHPALMMPGYDSKVFKDMHTKFGEARDSRGRAINFSKNYCKTLIQVWTLMLMPGWVKPLSSTVLRQGRYRWAARHCSTCTCCPTKCTPTARINNRFQPTFHWTTD